MPKYNSGEYDCEYCTGSFNTRDGYKQHLVKEHPDAVVNDYGSHTQD